MNNGKNINTNKFNWSLILWGVFICYFIFLCVFLEQNIDKIIDPEMSAELDLAKLLADAKSFPLTTNWFYSTEIRVLYMQWVFTPLFLVSNNWHFVRVIGTIICWLIMLASFYYLCYQLKLQKIFPVLGISLMCPLSLEYFTLVILGIFYLFHFAIIFFTIAAVLQLRNAERYSVREIIIAMLLGIITILSGMNGFRLMLNLYLPMLVVALIMLMINLYNHTNRNQTITKEFWQFLIVNIGVFVLALIGLLINLFVLGKYFSFYRFEEQLIFQKINIENFFELISMFFNCLGYSVGNIFDFKILLSNIVCILLLILIIVSLFDIIRNKNKYDFNEKFCTYLFFSSMLFYVVVNSFTKYEYIDNRHWLPVIIWALPVVAIYLSKLRIKLWVTEKYNQFLKDVLIGILALNIVTCAYQNINSQQYWSREEFLSIIDYLLDNNYHQGYGVFVNAGIIPELSNGQIEMWYWYYAGFTESDMDVLSFDEKGYYLQKKDHLYRHPEGKVFILLTQEENQRFTLAKQIQALPDYENYILIQTPEYIVYGFESYEILESLLS